MRELVELNQKDIEDALAKHFIKEKDWWRAKVTLPADGKGTIIATVERIRDTETDPY